MADNNYNPEDIIAREGRFAPRSRTRWPAVTIASIDFDILFGQLSTNIFHAVRHHVPLRRLYDGTAAEIDAALDVDIDALIGQALMELWNRLRIVAESYDPPTRNQIFARKAPSFDGFALPRFIASALSSIGPLRIRETFRDTTVIYAPAAATAANFGRAVAPAIDRLALQRILTNMRAANLPLGTIQSRGSQGSFFTTIDLLFTADNTFEMVGAFHHSLYTRNDVVQAMLFDTRDDEGNPFEDFFLTLGFVSDEATITALAAAAAPEEGIGADDPARHIHGDYNINPFGFAPPSDIPVAGRGRGIYILGRGRTREGVTSLARDLSQYEIDAIIAHRILHQAGPAAHEGLAPGLGANNPPQ